MIPDCLVLHHDAEQLERCDPLKKMQYDIIGAADVLEHLSNVGLFLSGARAFMRPDDRLLITTPNAYSMKRMLIPLPKLHESTASRVVRLRSGG